jgi:hypothetical protein
MNSDGTLPVYKLDGLTPSLVGDPKIIETELMEISGIAGDTIKFERIVVW